MSKIQLFLVQQRQSSEYVIKPAYISQDKVINCVQYEDSDLLYVKGMKLGIKTEDDSTNVDVLSAVKDVINIIKQSLKQTCPKQVSEKPEALNLQSEEINILTHKERLNIITELMDLKKRLEQGQELHVDVQEKPTIADPKGSFISFTSPKQSQKRQQVFVSPKKVYKVVDQSQYSQHPSTNQSQQYQNQQKDKFQSTFKALIKKIQQEQGVESPEFIRKHERDEENAFQVKKDKNSAQQPQSRQQTIQTPEEKDKTVRRHLREVLQEEKWQKLVSSQGSVGPTASAEKEVQKQDLNVSQHDEDPQEYVCEHYKQPDKRISLPNFAQKAIQQVLSLQGTLGLKTRQLQGNDGDVAQAFSSLDYEQRKKLFDQIANQLTTALLTEQMEEVVVGVQEILNHELEESIEVDDAQE